MPPRAKSPAQLGLAGALWVTAVMTLLVGTRSLLFEGSAERRCFYVVTFAFVAYCWLFSALHFVTFLNWSLQRLSTRKTRDAVPVPRPASSSPRVAIAYTCCNDFIRDCAQSCLEFAYPNLHLFICDDSSIDAAKAEVDRFVEANQGRCTLVRRAGRMGFKGGNLNNLLEHLSPDYAYLVLIDNDSVAPKDFIERALAVMEQDESLGFVQAPQRAWLPPTPTPFQAAIAMGIECMWRYQWLKNRFGLVLMVGHGAVLRTSALRHVGGFPNRVSEDLCVTTSLRAKGYRGLVLQSTPCEEGLPPSFAQYRRRFEKWVIGALEFARKDALRLALRAVPTVERVDLAVSVCSVLNVLLYGLFLLAMNVLWPLLFATRRIATVVSAFGNTTLSLPSLTLDFVPTAPIGLGARLILAAVSVAALVYFIPDSFRTPMKALRYVSCGFICFCGILVPCLVSSVMTITTGRYEYRVTNDVAEDRRWMRGSGMWRHNFYVGRLGSVAIEVAVGLAACTLAVVTQNLFLGSVALGILLAPVMDVAGWDFVPTRPLRHLPFLLFCAQLLFLAAPGWGAAAVTNSVVLIHF